MLHLENLEKLQFSRNKEYREFNLGGLSEEKWDRVFYPQLPVGLKELTLQDYQLSRWKYVHT